MTEPLFVALDEVLVLHRRSIELYGGTLGVRDQGGLEAAVFHPQNVYHYGRGYSHLIGIAEKRSTKEDLAGYLRSAARQTT